MINTEIADILSLELKRLNQLANKIHQSSVIDEIETTATNIEYALRLITPDIMVDALISSIEKADKKAA
ncbi:hypothetical protein [uncultured Kiloniella sp.]|uniref:hypothetical protein n=1 Tax=uncultured Kiloniella sp. TaxID=1133091 RepID=UPI0026364180|nr:hypothetical protein [uncultured Kiloniella sp.]